MALSSSPHLNLHTDPRLTSEIVHLELPRQHLAQGPVKKTIEGGTFQICVLATVSKPLLTSYS